MTGLEAPLARHRETVRPEWIDYNGHMNVAWYTLVFDHGTDAMLDALGLGAAYASAAGASLFVAEAHILYRRELALGAPLLVRTQLLGWDAKRLHLFHWLIDESDGAVAAMQEQMLLHVDLTTRRTATFPEAARGALAEMMAAHELLPRPAEAGRAVVGLE